MNAWYIAAIIFGAITAICTYYGSIVENKKNTDQQSTRIETALQSLGGEIQELRITGSSAADQSREVDAIDERYRSLAKDFFKSIPVRRAEEEVRTAQQQVDEIQKTQKVEAYFMEIQREAEKLAAAYNQSAGATVLELSSSPVPENFFRPSQEHPAHLLLAFRDRKYWAVRITSYPNQTLAIQFIRLLDSNMSGDFQQMELTNDSINLVILEKDFGLSLNSSISESVKSGVVADTPTVNQPLEKFSEVAANLTRRIIEYELLNK